MARQVAVAIENKFGRGLITEATGLNFPENACFETENCIFSDTGEASRRLGINYERTADDSFSVFHQNKAITEFIWEAAASSGDRTFFVQQLGSDIRFWTVGATAPISAGIKPFTINLLNFRAPGTTDAEINQNHCSFASGNGLLFVAHPYCDPIYVEYTPPPSEDFLAVRITVKIRDMEGLPNNYHNQLINSRPVPMDYNHRPLNAEFSEAVYYNLLNQGWYTKVISTPNGHRYANVAPLVAWRQGNTAWAGAGGGGTDSAVAGRTDWPSEADVWHLYKGIIHTPTTPPIPPSEGFSLQAIDKVDAGNSPTGKGHFILDAFAEDRLAAVDKEDIGNARGVQAALGNVEDAQGDAIHKTNITNRTSGKNRPAQIAFYAGRVWFAGISAEDYGTHIYFSQILEGTKNVDRCYQSQDPTSDVSSDLLPSDGGVIVIPEVARIVKLFVLGSTIFIFATNGVWKISGSTAESLGFTANDFAIAPVDDTVGASSALSFVNVAGLPMWWNNEGIWSIAPDQGGSMKVISISETRIQAYVDLLPNSERKWIKGAYNPSTKIVQWILRRTSSATVTDRYRYDTILNFDTNTTSFYPWTLEVTANSDYISGIFNVVATFEGNQINRFKYVSFAIPANRLIFAEFKNRNYIDWALSVPTIYNSHFTTGYKLRGDAIKKFQTNYIKVYANNIDPSTFDIFSKWDYTLTGNTGRWSSIQRVTMEDPTNYSVRVKRLKMRGHGLALQFKVASVEQEPFNIIGWTTWDTANATL